MNRWLPVPVRIWQLSVSKFCHRNLKICNRISRDSVGAATADYRQPLQLSGVCVARWLQRTAKQVASKANSPRDLQGGKWAERAYKDKAPPTEKKKAQHEKQQQQCVASGSMPRRAARHSFLAVAAAALALRAVAAVLVREISRVDKLDN